MNDNSKAITILCSMVGATENIKPLTPSEWDKLARKLLTKGLEPKDILFFSEKELQSKLECYGEERDRIERLIDRAGSLAFEIEKYENIGINIITRADSDYPNSLRAKLKSKCPPLFYVAGDLAICNERTIGFVGSRNIGPEEMNVTQDLVKRAVSNGKAIVSGGARGVDQVAQQTALLNEGRMIIYTADSMLKKIKDPEMIRAIRNKQAILLSVAKPDAGFNTGIAMMRNKYIYAQSEGTVVIQTDFNKGGTWNGAIEAINNNWCPVYCLKSETHRGNMELIKKGANPIEKTWNCELKEQKIVEGEFEEAEQLSLFSII